MTVGMLISLALMLAEMFASFGTGWMLSSSPWWKGAMSTRRAHIGLYSMVNQVELDTIRLGEMDITATLLIELQFLVDFVLAI